MFFFFQVVSSKVYFYMIVFCVHFRVLISVVAVKNGISANFGLACSATMLLNILLKNWYKYVGEKGVCQKTARDGAKNGLLLKVILFQLFSEILISQIKIVFEFFKFLHWSHISSFHLIPKVLALLKEDRTKMIIFIIFYTFLEM